MLYLSAIVPQGTLCNKLKVVEVGSPPQSYFQYLPASNKDEQLEKDTMATGGLSVMKMSSSVAHGDDVDVEDDDDDKS